MYSLLPSVNGILSSYHSYTSHLEMLRRMVYTPFFPVLIVYQAVITVIRVIWRC